METQLIPHSPGDAYGLSPLAVLMAPGLEDLTFSRAVLGLADGGSGAYSGVQERVFAARLQSLTGLVKTRGASSPSG